MLMERQYGERYGQPLPGAAVAVVTDGGRIERGTATGPDGSSRIDGVVPGDRRVEVRYLGWSSQDHHIPVRSGYVETICAVLTATGPYLH